ncbi:MAG TPA: AI-2E family transporter [Pyrinomonadaceae bacterium]|nr:AI-2E family transporter [Pyrinomonadaceae bacterium]
MKDRQIQARLLALLIATAVALYLCWLMLQPFVNVLAWAAVLVIFFYPVHRRLVARTGRPATSALLSSLFVIVVILLPLALITFAVINQMAGALQNLQASAASLLDPNSPVTGRIIGWLGQYVNIEQLQSEQFLLDRLKGLSGTIAGNALGFVGGLVGVIVQVFFVIFTMYYLFRDGDRIVRALPDMLPLERAQSEVIFERTRDVISASLYGVLVIAMIQGALGGLAFWMLGLPSAIVWAVVMTFLSMIPMAGAFFVWVPAAIYLAMTGHWGKALILVAWGTLVIGTIDNFLRPKLVGERTRLHELFIFFSVLGGLKVFGVLGIVLGPVVLAITIALLDVFRQAEKSAPSTMPEPSLPERGAASAIETGTANSTAADQGQGRAAISPSESGVV